MRKIIHLIMVLAGVALVLPGIAGSALAESFEQMLAGLYPKARAVGISDATWREATKGLTPDPKIPNLVVSQPEFTTPIWDYLDKRVSDSRISRGRAAMAAKKTVFDRVGKATGVDPAILGAIWGIETDFGGVLGNTSLIKPIIRSLATLVYQDRGRRAADESELFAAMMLVERGFGTPDTLVGSWGGAIGHLQVGPSIILKQGTDGDGDGRVDVHSSLADALATSAKFLISIGYQPGLDWGLEVEVPDGFDYLLADREELRPLSFFADLGVRRVAGRPFARRDVPVFLYVPAGQTGPKFLMTQNYLILKGYNFSDSYAMAVAHLADRLKGSGPFVTPWPRNTRFPNLEQRIAVQKALRDKGFYEGEVDGRIGPKTQAAYQRFQAARGLVADGFITLKAYELLLK